MKIAAISARALERDSQSVQFLATHNVLRETESRIQALKKENLHLAKTNRELLRELKQIQASEKSRVPSCIDVTAIFVSTFLLRWRLAVDVSAFLILFMYLLWDSPRAEIYTPSWATSANQLTRIGDDSPRIGDDSPRIGDDLSYPVSVMSLERRCFPPGLSRRQSYIFLCICIV